MPLSRTSQDTDGSKCLFTHALEGYSSCLMISYYRSFNLSSTKTSSTHNIIGHHLFIYYSLFGRSLHYIPRAGENDMLRVLFGNGAEVTFTD